MPDLTLKAPPDRAEFYASLAAAQGEMGGALKDSKNPHFSSDYASLASVLAAVLPPLNRHGLALLQTPDMEAGIVTVSTMLVHKTGEQLTFVSSCPVGGRKDVQAFGSAVTYLRRYSLMSIAGIAPVDDDGNDASRGPNLARQQQAPPRQQASGSNASSGDMVAFIKVLKARKLGYETVATFCEKQRWGRPSEWSNEDRANFLVDLDNVAFPDLYDPSENPPLVSRSVPVPVPSRRAAEPDSRLTTAVALNAEELQKALSPMGLSLTTVSAWCAATKRLAPVEMTAAAQDKMLTWLEDGGCATVNKWAAEQAG